MLDVSDAQFIQDIQNLTPIQIYNLCRTSPEFRLKMCGPEKFNPTEFEMPSSEIASSEIAPPELASTKIASSEIASTKIVSSEMPSSEIASSEIAPPELASSEIASLKPEKIKDGKNPGLIPPSYWDRLYVPADFK